MQKEREPGGGGEATLILRRIELRASCDFKGKGEEKALISKGRGRKSSDFKRKGKKKL